MTSVSSSILLYVAGVGRTAVDLGPEGVCTATAAPGGGSVARVEGARYVSPAPDPVAANSMAATTVAAKYGKCRVHKPGVPRGPASTPGLGLGKQHIVHGPAQKSKIQWARRVVRSPTGGTTLKKQVPVRQLL